MNWFTVLDDRAPFVSLLATTGDGRGSAILLVIVLVALTSLQMIAGAAPSSRFRDVTSGVMIVLPPLIIGFLIATGLSVAGTIR